jgi:hypothetical protein
VIRGATLPRGGRDGDTIGTGSYRFGHVLAPHAYKLGVVDTLATPTQLLHAVTEASETGTTCWSIAAEVDTLVVSWIARHG